MDAQAIAALVQLGVAGVFLYAFLSDRLRTKASSDQRDELWARSYAELKADRDEWRRLALGTERRLDAASSTVATAIGAPVPSPQPQPLER